MTNHDLKKELLEEFDLLCAENYFAGQFGNKHPIEKNREWLAQSLARLYYTAPSDEIFDLFKQRAIQFWRIRYGDDPVYVKEKVDQIQDMQNIRDNFMYILAMFDPTNQRSICAALPADVQEAIRLPLIDGGQPPEFMPL